MEQISPVRAARGPYRNLWFVLALMVPAAVLAFTKSYIDGRSFSGLTMTKLIHLHSALMVLWIVLLIAQAWFIRTKRYTLHRWAGRSSFVIAPLIIVLTLAAAAQTLNRKMPDITPLDARFEIYTWGQVIPFGLAWALALIYRKRIPLHVRFMVSTAFAFGSAIVFRVLLNCFAWVPGLGPEHLDAVAVVNGSLLVLPLVALIVMDWKLGIRRSPFWLVTVTTVLMHIGFFTFTKTQWWSGFVDWYGSLAAF